ncbi:MAG: DNA-processing protein DprA [Patescibacteria group bacterium]|nr:DNA-processing protein DprA [Patescibacteria group bacterium]
MEKDSEELKYWLIISNNPKIGSIGFKQILDTKVKLKTIYNSSKKELMSYGLSNRIVQELLVCQKEYKPELVINNLKSNHISVITLNSPKYPKLLREIYDPPGVLYYKGSFDHHDLMIGIVGSRKPTDYGRHITYELSYDLAKAGITIVSGLALGIDSIAHQAALDAKGKTVAVLGCGLDNIYPGTHRKLAQDILESGGAIISEYPIGVPPLKQNFPARNRIISGLSQGLVVTEAAEGSGSLITARAALDQNREVFAIPGPIYNKNSFGPNNLIKVGAHMVIEVQDVFDEFGLVAPKETINMRRMLPDNPSEEIIFKVLKDNPKHINMIIKESALKQNDVSSLITMMEISGKIKHLGGMIYRLNN